ncbi:MAG: ABC transporter substrate-binding protein [Rhodospirillales bacterium]
MIFSKSPGIRPLATLAAVAFLALAPQAQAQEGTLVIARDMDLNSLDPHRGWCDTCQIYNTSVYEQLTTLNADNQVVPLLAESWEVNPGQTEFIFKMNPKAVFSDGSPVEAKDVKWSFERLKNLKANASFLTDPIKTIEAPDKVTVKISLVAANSEFLQILAAGTLSVINSDVAIAQGALSDASAVSGDTAEAWLLANSAGSGPFLLESYEPNAELRLKRNQSYWRDAPGFDEVVFRQVRDAVSQAQMLQSGSVDIAMQVDPETAKVLTGGDTTVQSVPSYNFVYVALAPGAEDLTVELTPEVREALSLAIDRTALIDFTLAGAGRALATPIPLGFPGSDGETITPYDPDSAKALLAKAGHVDGFTIKAVYPDMNVYGIDFSLMMQKVAQDLDKIGVTVDLNPVPFANWREQVNGPGIPMTLVFYAPDFFGTSQYVDYFGLIPGSVWSDRASGGKGPPVVNTKIAAVRDAALAAPSAADAAKKWDEAGIMMREDRIILPMVSPDLMLAYRKGIEGVRYSLCCNLPLAEISN